MTWCRYTKGRLLQAWPIHYVIHAKLEDMKPWLYSVAKYEKKEKSNTLGEAWCHSTWTPFPYQGASPWLENRCCFTRSPFHFTHAALSQLPKPPRYPPPPVPFPPSATETQRTFTPDVPDRARQSLFSKTLQFCKSFCSYKPLVLNLSWASESLWELLEMQTPQSQRWRLQLTWSGAGLMCLHVNV